MPSEKQPTTPQDSSWPLFVVPAAILVMIYALTLSRAHGWDSIAYTARAVGDPFLSERYLSTKLFHPHHLLYVPLAMAARWGYQAAGGADPFIPIELLNSILGAGSALLAGVLARRIGGGGTTVAVVLATGLSNAVWRYSTEVEVMVPSLFFLLLSTWLASRARSTVGWVIAGVALSASILLHQIAFLFALASTVTLLAAGRRANTFIPTAGISMPYRPGRQAAWVFSAGWVLPTAAAYLLVGFLSEHARSAGDLINWMLAAHSRSTFSSHGAALFKETGRALATSWVTLAPFKQLRVAPSPVAFIAAAAGFSALALAAWFTVPSLPRLGRALRSVSIPALLLVSGGGLMILFVIWFQPWNDDYWVYFPPIACALVGGFAPSGSRWSKRAATALIILLGSANLVAQTLPAADPGRASYADLLNDARNQFQPGDVIVSGGADSPIGEGIVALPFFAGVRVLPVVDRGHAADQERFRQELAAEARQGWTTGHAVYATAEALPEIRLLWPESVLAPAGELRGERLSRITTSGPGPPGPGPLR